LAIFVLSSTTVESVGDDAIFRRHCGWLVRLYLLHKKGGGLLAALGPQEKRFPLGGSYSTKPLIATTDTARMMARDTRSP
jgi:hypothetical protein